MKTFVSEKVVISISKGGKPYDAFEKDGRKTEAGVSKPHVKINNGYSEIKLSWEDFEGCIKTFQEFKKSGK